MADLLQSVRQGFLDAGMPQDLVAELLTAFSEAKDRYFRNDLRPSELEGGRFSEAVFRILQWATAIKVTKVGKSLPNTDVLIRQLETASGPDSIRLHIPRTLRLIYDIRNKRDVGHLSDGIDANIQDASLVVHNMDWVLAELVRLYHNVTPLEAHSMICELVSKKVPAIQIINDYPKILRTLGPMEHLLILLYWSGTKGANLDELKGWARPSMIANIRRTLSSLDTKNLIHKAGEHYVITHLGEKYIETKKVLEPL